MPIKKSAKKYMRVTKTNTARNRSVKGVIKSTVKKTLDAIQKSDLAVAQEWYKKAQKAIDKAAEKKVIKKNTAARKKSRLNARVKKLAQK